MLVRIKFVILILTLSITPSVFAENQTPVVSEEMKKRVEQQIKEIKLPEHIKERAEKLKEYTESEEYLEKQHAYEAKIKRLLELDNSGIEPTEKAKNYSETDRFVLFVSSSLPESTLRRYAKSIEKVNGLMVFRGTVGGRKKMMPTIQFMERILKVDPFCETQPCEYFKANVTIDPRLFELNDIKQVPALIFIENMDFSNYLDKHSGDGMPTAANAIVYGDASLSGMAKELYRMTKNPHIEAQLSRF